MNTAKAIWETKIETVKMRKGARTKGENFEARDSWVYMIHKGTQSINTTKKDEHGFKDHSFYAN